MNEQSDSSRCSDAREWERWRRAGELWGRVKKGLGFGEVALYDDGRNQFCVTVQWWFNAKGQRYSRAYSVSDEELVLCVSIEAYANSIVSRMKSEAREKVGKDVIDPVEGRVTPQAVL